MARKTNAHLAAEIKQLKAQLATAKGTNAPKKAKKVWHSMTGYACGSEFTMNRANSGVKRHLTGACGCDSQRGFRCRVVKWDDSPFAVDSKGMGLAKARKAGLIR